MGKSVELSITEPIYNTYGHQTVTTAVFRNNSSLHNWVLNSLIFLCCNPNFLFGLSTSPEIFVSQSGYQDCPYLERKYISLKFLGSKFHAVIRAMLEDGCYVYFSNIDDSRIRKKNRYYGRIFFQSGLICGYDQDEKTYSILTCDEDWNNQIMKIPQKWLEQGRLASLESGVHGTLCAIRPKPDSVKLNISEIHRNLKQYLEGDYKKYPPYESSGKVYGSVVHDYIAMYLNFVMGEIIPYEQIDRKVFRQLWEHKKNMLERLTVVEEQMGFDRSISKKYNSIVQKSEELRDLYTSYCLERRDKILPKLRDELIALRKKEDSVLTECVLKMEGVM